MFFRLMYHIVLPIYVIFVIFSSITLNRSQNHFLVILLGILFITSIYLESIYPRYKKYISAIELILLLLFHFTSQLNWCFSIYIILLSKFLFQIRGALKGIFLGFVMIAFYSVIRISYTPLDSYSILAIGSDFLTSLAVVLIIQYIIEVERQKNVLKEEKKREELRLKEEKMNLLSEMAAGLAHEIRNPLTIIQGFLQHSKHNQYNIQPWYDLFLSEVKRMNKLTTEFLQFSKPNVSLYQSHSIHECLTTVISLTESRANSLGHQIVYREYNSHLSIQMDFDKMVQVFVNLINNSIQSMVDSGTITIRLLEINNNAVVEVMDTGIGINKADLEKIFNPFYTTKPDGTGLGLSICQKIILDHGGTIEAASTLNHGTSFTICFPINSAE
ncbi:ATP-binding protein [Paenibacillus sp. BSR1-1]|uniref:two-component system sensor histidine kinase NtrB n=1 Tax=Paenibacillus sp. BSR1-1 TaxID=3020845 RepID=UPI0025B0239A|nr:ATP-binding protein [Paenibacillus sp. BSR1-1]MDN3015903.1 ATP-binding protein [Paenibacillus sp. BSR1-1]